MATIKVSGFGNKEANGVYLQSIEVNNLTSYKKVDETHIIVFKFENGPYSFAPAYYIAEVVKTTNNTGIPFLKYIYSNQGVDPITGTWKDLTPQGSNEEEIGTVFFDNESSMSSGSSSSSSYSSSSSSSYSSSSSSTDSSSSSFSTASSDSTELSSSSSSSFSTASTASTASSDSTASSSSSPSSSSSSQSASGIGVMDIGGSFVVS